MRLEIFESFSVDNRTNPAPEYLFGVRIVTLLESLGRHRSNKYGYQPISERLSSVMEEHIILGIDKRDAEKQRDLWLSQNPDIRVVKIHRAKPEPRTLLTRIGGKSVPRVSITIEYEYEKSNALLQASRTAVPSEKSHGEKDGGGSGKQSARENLFAGKAHLHMKDMAQHPSGQYRGEDDAE